MIDACLRLGNYEDSLGNYEEAFNCYKRGLESIDETTTPSTVEELYFRYAVALDEAGDENNATSYYKKYLKTNGEDFKSATLCNLGIICQEKGDIKTAEKYFTEAFKFDTTNNNYDGIYYSSIQLAQLLFDTNLKKAYKYIQSAINSAEILNDSFYVAQARILIGDYYYRINDNENALKEYINVYISVKDDFSKENIKKITDRIRDMELRLGSEKYTEIMKKYG
jgi:tetratricopeptide (TPR) repeat protein